MIFEFWKSLEYLLRKRCGRKRNDEKIFGTQYTLWYLKFIPHISHFIS